ncbi:hypothetical protein [Cellulosimicrobium cellulans]|uniref:hypothetical protein n=1 Tax=Cellulosimicrobium cellulans TaxID=1710 RepID=UPI003C579EE0
MSTLDARDNLNHIAHHWADLQHQLGGLKSTPTDKITVATSSDPQAPINLHVLDLLDEIRSWAWWAVGQLEVHAGITADLGFSDTAALRHLAQHHECWDGVDDFEHAAQRFRRKIDRVIKNNQRTYLGPCTSRGEDKAGCTGEIYATNDSTRGACPVCGAEWQQGHQENYILAQLDDVLMTPVELHHALRNIGHVVPRGTIRSWISRGRLKSEEEDLYRLADALKLATTNT